MAYVSWLLDRWAAKNAAAHKSAWAFLSIARITRYACQGSRVTLHPYDHVTIIPTSEKSSLIEIVLSRYYYYQFLEGILVFVFFPSKRTRVIFIFRCTDPSFALIRNRINRKIWSPSINKEAFRIRIFFIRLIFIYSSMNNDKTRFKDSIYSSTNYKACVSGSWLIYRCFYYCSFLHGPLDQFIG